MSDAAMKSRRAEAWIRSCTRFGAAQWLHAVPTMDCFRADTYTYRVMLLRWLGMPLPGTSVGELPICAGGNCSQAHDASLVCGFHWDTGCSLAARERHRRHNAFRDVWFSAYREAGVDVEWEPRGLYRGSDARPADVMIPAHEGDPVILAVVGGPLITPVVILVLMVLSLTPCLIRLPWLQLLMLRRGSVLFTRGR